MKDMLSLTAKIGVLGVSAVHTSATDLAQGIQVAPLPGEQLTSQSSTHVEVAHEQLNKPND